MSPWHIYQNTTYQNTGCFAIQGKMQPTFLGTDGFSKSMDEPGKPECS